MANHPKYYRLTEQRNDIEAGTVFRLVARYGTWHPRDAKLESTDPDHAGSVQVTMEELEDTWEAAAVA